MVQYKRRCEIRLLEVCGLRIQTGSARTGLISESVVMRLVIMCYVFKLKFKV